MNSEQTGYAEEESSIPPPDVSGADTDDGDMTEEQMVLADLKNRAKTLGVKFHPSIGEDKLREKIQAALEGVEEEEEKTSAVPLKKSSDATLKAEQLKLIRVRITNMDPMKKNHQGDFFLTGNSLVGTVKRYVPFGVEWHVPQIILNMIKEKQFQQFSNSKNAKGQDISTSKLVKTYAVEILTPLSEQELKELGRVQAMKRGEETD